MKSAKLPLPIDIKLYEKKTLLDVIDYIYYNYFKCDFMDIKRRNKLFGKFIFLDMDFLNYKPERFWHIISFNPNQEKFTVSPCVNSKDYLLCKSLKSKCEECLHIPLDERLKDRCECLYRLTRINWINPILELANKKDESVKVWCDMKKDKSNGKTMKITYIRFEHELADYLIVLRDNPKNRQNEYKFITAYPIVHNGTKKRLNNSYNKYIKNKC